MGIENIDGLKPVFQTDLKGNEIMAQAELRDTDPLCKHTKIAVGCDECAAERAAAEAARKAEEEKK